MRRKRKDYEDNWRMTLIKTMLTLITTAIIVWVLPRDEGKKYNYDMDKPWTYGTFIAPFDFPVMKSPEVLKAEQDSVGRLTQPYYYIDNSIEDRQIEFFMSNARKSGLLADGVIGSIARQMHVVYHQGIINNETYDELAADSTKTIRLVKGNNAMAVDIKEYYSEQLALNKIKGDPIMALVSHELDSIDFAQYIVPNVIYDKDRTETEREDLKASIAASSGVVQAGQKIIDRGEIVDAYTYNVLTSYDIEMSKNVSRREFITTLAGQTVFVLILVTLFTVYLTLYRDDYFDKMRSIIMLYSLMILFPVLVSLMIKSNFLSIYVLPMAMAPIFIRVFMDSRTAFYTHAIITMICCAAVKYQYEFLLVQLTSGLVAIFTLRELSKRSQVFVAAVLVSLTEFAVYCTLLLMQNTEDFSLSVTMIYYFITAGVLLLLTYPLMYVVEKLFGFVSSVTLFELSDTNHDLLRRLSETAPGTFQHSITVSNIASNIAKRIGAKPLLVRVGALYHDIGKMGNAVYFTENQSGINPHNQLTETESAQMIISHVTEGLKMAEKANLPTVIVDFIRTHHGSGLTKYFYIQYKNKHPEEVDIEEMFSYPGPNPFTKEQAILMMADTVEAAARSLPEYTQESVTSLVNRIIDGQVQQGYYRDCPITFQAIAMAKEVLIENLMSIYHTRIAYPEEK